MFYFSPVAIESLGVTATNAATYLDRCEAESDSSQIHPAYYKACGKLLKQIFTLIDPYLAFPQLLDQSAAAREMAESIRLGVQIELVRQDKYSELSVVIRRAAS